jgi:hypothetical protein
VVEIDIDEALELAELVVDGELKLELELELVDNTLAAPGLADCACVGQTLL